MVNFYVSKLYTIPKLKVLKSKFSFVQNILNPYIYLKLIFLLAKFDVNTIYVY